MDNSTQAPRVSIIIPSWTGEVGRLMASVEAQTFQDYEVEIVRGVSPAARARNVGVERSRGEILLFIDDDAYFGNAHALQRLVELLDSDPMVGVVGTSKLAPPEATPLQHAIARQVPRMIYPVVHADEESNPPLDRYGFTAVTTTCCAVRRAAFDAVGGFDEKLTTGPEDTDFFYRVRRAGYRILVAADTWVYHDPPSSMRDLLRKSFWYGIGHALEARKNPERRMAVLPLDRWYGKIALVALPIAFPYALFIHPYFDPVRRIEFGFRPLKTLSTYSVLAGYIYGWYRGNPQAKTTTYMGRKGAQTGETETRPAKVLYIDAYPKIGGGQQVLYSIVSRLDGTRYTPLVALPPRSPMRQRLARAGVRSVGVPFSDRNLSLPKITDAASVARSASSVVGAVRAIMRVARHENVDIIHANSAVAGVHALPAAMMLRLPCVVHSHDFLTASTTNRVLKLMMRYEKSAMIFVSHALANFYGAASGKFRYSVIHNGVDTRVFRPDPGARTRFLEECKLPPDCFLVGAVGRLEPGKGFGLLLEAFALVAKDHPTARLVVVGEAVFDRMNSARRDLEDKVERLGLKDRVVFTGFREDVPSIMAALDVLVHCPTDPEGFGLILVEAMACGRPVVTVPEGGIVEVVTNGKNGIIVPAGDVGAIARAIGSLAGDSSLARRLGEVGRRTVEEHFSVELQASEVQTLYDEMLGRGGDENGYGLKGGMVEAESALGD